VKKIIILTGLCIVLMPKMLFAQTLINETICGGGLVSGEMDASCIPEYIAYLIQQLFMLTGALSLIMIMIGGFEYTLDKLVGGKEKGVKRIRNGILGLVISGFAFFIVRFAILALKGP
jgi:hypothetical protein